MSDSEKAAPLEAKQRRLLVTVLALTGTFCAFELGAAFVARSEVLKADALHLSMDVTALVMSLTAMRLAARAPSEAFPFGLARAEPLAAVLNAGLVLIGTFVIVKNGVAGILGFEVDDHGHGHGHEHGPRVGLMAVVSIAALLVNGLSAWLLHRGIGHAHHGHAHGHHGHAHGHGHSHGHHGHAHGGHDHAHGGHDHHGHGDDHHGHDHHDHDREHAHEAHAHGHAHDEHGAGRAHHENGDHSLNLRGAWLHVLGDALGSVAALTTAGLMHFGAPAVVDPIASLLVATILLLGAGRLLRDAVRVLLEGAPAHLSIGVVRTVVRAVPGVETVTDVRTWSLGAGQDAAAVRIRGGGVELGVAVEKAIREKLAVEHVWVHVEPERAP